MALVKKIIPLAAAQIGGKTSAVATREAEEQRKKARTLAKQQAAERIASVFAAISPCCVSRAPVKSCRH